MKIILSPAKKMKLFDHNFLLSKPLFIKEAKQIHQLLINKNFDELKTLWNCSDKIAQEAYNYLSKMDFETNLTPAIFSYIGIQYQYLAIHLLENQYLDYVKDHIFVLSGFYGLLRAFDGINLYRLEMQTKLLIDNNDLYQFYQNKVFKELTKNNEVIINLASNEYSKLIDALMINYPYITISFVEKINDKYVSKGVRVKMARGAMARYIIENRIDNPIDLKNFNEMNYFFNKDLSNDKLYVFELIKSKDKL